MKHDLQLWNTRIKVQDVQNEEKNRNATRNVIQTSWNAELKCYENGARQHPQHINRFFDPRIFPYDKSCSLLLDMYLCVEGEFPYKIPFYVEEFARRNDDVVLEEGYLPNSAYAIWASLVPLPRAEAYSLTFIAAVNDLEEQQQQQQRLIQRGGEDGKKNTRNNSTIWISSSDNALACDFSYLDSWLDGLSSEMYQWVTCDGYDKGNDLQNGEEKNKRGFNINDETQFRNDYFQGLPSIGSLPKGVRTKVLLKLLKHSMSEIQRDHRLSRAVLLALVEYQCLDGHDGVEAFRYFLLTVESEFIHDCDEDCQHGGADESDDDDSSSGATVGHVCSDWRRCVHTLTKVIQLGIRTFTEQHGLILCCFFRSLLDSTGWKEVDDLQMLIGWNDDDYTMAKDTPFHLIRAILDGLSRLNYQYRCRIVNLLRIKYANELVREDVDKDLHAVVKSHIYCTRTLVCLGEIVLKSCRATPVTESIGSILVTGLTLSSIFPLTDHNWYLDNDIEGNYIGSMNGSGRSLIDVTRYADCVARASYLKETRIMMFKRQFGIHANHQIEEDGIVSNLFLKPLDSIQTVVRGLYLRQLVESNEAGCGYGDFVVWSGGKITPFEPLLFEHNMNYPNKTGYDENELEDERGEELNVEQIKAMYDLSLLMLRKEWTMPWTPASHESFSPPFKRAIQTIALIAHRHDFPLELCVQINSFISRDWWPSDEDAKCWRYECQIDRLGRYLNHENVEDENANVKPLIKCNGCRIAHACSKKHLKDIFHHDGHRRLCRCPPFRVPTVEDNDICHRYLRMEVDTQNQQAPDEKGRHSFHKQPLEQEEEEEEGDDDDDEWKSIGSEGDSDTAMSRIDIVVKYFEDKAYKVQRIEDHAFASHYME